MQTPSADESALPSEVEALGAPLEVFGPARDGLAGALAAGLLMIGVTGAHLVGVATGVIRPNRIQEAISVIPFEVRVIASGCVFVIGLFVLRHTRRLYRSSFSLCPGGFIHFDGAQLEVFPWGQIESIEKGDRGRVWIKRIDGCRSFYSPDRFRDADRLTALLRAAAEQHGIPWRDLG